VRARLLQASYKKEALNDAPGLEDFTPTDFSAQPDQPPASAPETKPQEKSPEVTMTVDEGGDIVVPDFSGKTMRQVTQMCLKLGLDPVLVGSSLATGQTPTAGVKLRHGGRVTVQFGFVTPKTQKAAKKR